MTVSLFLFCEKGTCYFMERTIQYQIKDTDPVQKISGFLRQRGYSQKNLTDLRKEETAIALNGQYVHMNTTIASGDVLTVHISETETSGQILPVHLSFEIVYEDEDLLVIHKPAGMPIHPSRNNPDNSLGNALAYYFKQKKQPFVFRCINRLDRDTSGLTIVAKHAVSAAILGQMVRAKSEGGLKSDGIHREYLALVEGNVTPASGVISAPIARKEDRCLRRVVDFARGDRAVTHYRVLTVWSGKKMESLQEQKRSIQEGQELKKEQQKSRSLVALQLETGRTHQIRVHMAYLGYPLVGDFLYNPAYQDNQIDRRENCEHRQQSDERSDVFRNNADLKNQKEAVAQEHNYDINRQALHAWKLTFPHPMTGEPMEFTAPLPEDMKKLLEKI